MSGSAPSNVENRDGFKSKWGFILACIGSAVGMANIWRFPYMVATYGGMTFLLPYFLFVVLIGMSGVMVSFSHGKQEEHCRKHPGNGDHLTGGI